MATRSKLHLVLADEYGEVIETWDSDAHDEAFVSIADSGDTSPYTRVRILNAINTPERA